MTPPASQIALIRTHGRTGAEQRALQRAVHRGRLVRIRAGVLADVDHVAALDARERYRLLVRASLPYVPPGAALSHLSSSVLRGWPHVGDWPDRVHVIDPGASRNRSTRWFAVHAGARHPPPTGANVDGVPIVSRARTVADLARVLPLAESLPIVDHALRHRETTADALLHELHSSGRHALDRATRAIELGSPLSDSAAESLCRVRFIELATPTPVQQHRFDDGHRTAIVDFWFAEQGVVVEVDGRVKYEDPAMLRGRSPSQALWAEKQREDWIRGRPGVRFVVRVTWAMLMAPERLRAELRRVGVPCR
jgi:hypothetical protein